MGDRDYQHEKYIEDLPGESYTSEYFTEQSESTGIECYEEGLGKGGSATPENLSKRVSPIKSEKSRGSASKKKMPVSSSDESE